MHQHFALSTTLRFNRLDSLHEHTSSYTTMIMESMGIRYKPTTCLGTVVDQSVKTLSATRGYGAGSYWNSIFGSSIGKSVPSITVLGKSTRSYFYLRSIAKGITNSLSQKYSGKIVRNVQAGIIPEKYDCIECMEH